MEGYYTVHKMIFTACFAQACIYLDGSSKIDTSLYGCIIGGLEKGPLQKQSKEQQHSQYIGISKKLLRGDEINP